MTPAAGVSAVNPRRWTIIAGGCGVAVIVAASRLRGGHLGRGKKVAAKPFEHVKVARLTQDGRAGEDVAISPDGRYVAYLVGDDKGREGLWVQQVATSTAVQVVPPTESMIGGAMFSPDGNYLYYCSYLPTEKKRLPTLPGSRPGGGQDPQAVEDIDTAPTFSPDGKRLAFVRDKLRGTTAHNRQHRRHRGKNVGHRRGPQKPAGRPMAGAIAWARKRAPGFSSNWWMSPRER